MKEKKIFTFPLYFILLLYFEILFRIFAVESIFSGSFVIILFYYLFLASILTMLTGFFKTKINRILFRILLGFLTIWYGAEIVFQSCFQVYFSVSSVFFADQALSFTDKIVSLIFTNLVPVLLLIIPFFLSFFYHSKIQFKIPREKRWSVFISGILCYLVFWGFLYGTPDLKELYVGINNNALNKETFGAIPSSLIEIRKRIFPPKTILYLESPIEEIEVVEEEEVTYQRNILDIDYQRLKEQETDETIGMMHDYFASDIGTLQNQYTGYFKDKNLILIMAESFNSIAVDPKLTPTLYKLSHEGFVFENFYTPVILSTIGGEFQELTGLYPNLSKLSNVWRKGVNYYPFGFGRVFEDLNYDVHAYHNHTYSFQNRDTYLSSLGFTDYIGCKNGLENKINCNNWPESDVEMIQATVSDYLYSDKFFTYYVTVSGHMSYDFKTNAMAIKNQEYVKDLPYSTDILAYLATQIELDRALELLIEKLEFAGQLDDTVIALVGDHYPYDIDIEHINEIANPSRDEVIEVNRSNFILWSNKMNTVSVSKVGGNMDVLPTLLNLFGISYDSRLIMGKDLLADGEGLVIFDDSSWVSDTGKYLARSKTFISKEEEISYNEYVTKINQVVSNRIHLSKLIMETDYYRKVLGE